MNGHLEMLLDQPVDSGRTRSNWRVAWTALKFSLLGIVVGTVMFTGGFWLFAHHVSRLSAPKNLAGADAIIVLTGGQARINAAVDLLKSGKGKRLLISGVNPRSNLRQIQVATGGDKALFNCCVDIDYAALDTIGNAEESAKWVGSHAYRSVILVTNNYHMPRSLLEMGRLMGNAELRPYPVVNSRLDDGIWMTKPDALRVMFTEYAKYLASLARGVITPRPPRSDVTVAKATLVAG